MKTLTEKEAEEKGRCKKPPAPYERALWVAVNGLSIDVGSIVYV